LLERDNSIIPEIYLKDQQGNEFLEDIQNYLTQHPVNNNGESQSKPMEILLTGATGFLGTSF
jgi:hypothetical protein